MALLVQLCWRRGRHGGEATEEFVGARPPGKQRRCGCCACVNGGGGGGLHDGGGAGRHARGKGRREEAWPWGSGSLSLMRACVKGSRERCDREGEMDRLAVPWRREETRSGIERLARVSGRIGGPTQEAQVAGGAAGWASIC